MTRLTKNTFKMITGILMIFLLMFIIGNLWYEQGLKEGRINESFDQLRKPDMFVRRNVEIQPSNYIFYDNTYGQVISVYSDLREVEAKCLVRYLYPKECELTFIKRIPIPIINQELTDKN
jgi:hypothetical protein